MTLPFFQRNKHIILYGTSLAALLLLLNWLKLRLVILDHAFEVYVGTIAALFTGLGIWLALKLSRPKVVTEKQPFPDNTTNAFAFNTAEAERLHLSKRELEVLALMARGMSNQEISEALFVSISTIKTHSNNLFDKLEVKRRTQAVEKGRKLGLIPG